MNGRWSYEAEQYTFFSGLLVNHCLCFNVAYSVACPRFRDSQVRLPSAGLFRRRQLERPKNDV